MANALSELPGPKSSTQSPADRFMRALLRIPEPQVRERGSYADRGKAEQGAERLFGTSILISAVRCLITYIVLPVLAPLLGLAAGVGAAIGIPVGIVAITFDILGIRRFWLAGHRWRWPVTFVYAGVIALLAILFVQDLSHLSH